MSDRLLRSLPFVIVGGWILWLIVLLLAGYGVNLFGPLRFDFELAGQFGDSFGGLSGLMASLAAAGAWYAVSLERTAGEKQERAREKEEALRRQEAFERNFFQLLEHLSALVRETDIVSASLRAEGPSQSTGKDAFRRILNVLRRRIHSDFGKENFNPVISYNKFYTQYQDDLGHYFRVLFHICNYINNNETIDRNFYMKILFAQLSNSELLLVAYNCSFGRGRQKFKPILEKYDALSNIGFDDGFELEEKLIRDVISAGCLPPLN